jgi:hypothetical protein
MGSLDRSLQDRKVGKRKVIIERIWAMPNGHTFTIKPIAELLDRELSGVGYDPFSGLFSLANFRNDLNPSIPCVDHDDALLWLQKQPSNAGDYVLFDPPYSITQATSLYSNYGKDKLKIHPSNMLYWKSVKDEMARIIKPGGKAICFGWSSMGLGLSRNFEMTHILLVPHGGSKNDTIVTVEIKQ